MCKMGGWTDNRPNGQPASQCFGKIFIHSVMCCTSNYQICLIISVKRVFVDSLVVRWSHRKYSLFPFAFDLFAILLLCWYLIFDVRMIYAWKIWLNSHYLKFYRHRKRSHIASQFRSMQHWVFSFELKSIHTFQSGIFDFFNFCQTQNKTKLYFNWMKKNQVQD